MPLQLRGMSETSWCIKQASCRKRICFLFKTIFVWLVHTCQGVPVSVKTALVHHSLPTFMWDMGIKLRAPGLCSKWLYWMCHLPCPPTTTQFELSSLVVQYMLVQILEHEVFKERSVAVTQTKGRPLQSCAALTFLSLIQNLGEGSAVPNFIILLTFSYFWIYRHLLFIF